MIDGRTIDKLPVCRVSDQQKCPAGWCPLCSFSPWEKEKYPGDSASFGPDFRPCFAGVKRRFATTIIAACACPTCEKGLFYAQLLVSALLLLPLGEGRDEGPRSSKADGSSFTRNAIALPQALTGLRSNSQNPHPCLLPEGEGEIPRRFRLIRP